MNAQIVIVRHRHHHVFAYCLPGSTWYHCTWQDLLDLLSWYCILEMIEVVKAWEQEYVHAATCDNLILMPSRPHTPARECLKTHYVIKVQNGCLDFICWFLCERGNSVQQRSVVLGTGLLLMNKFRRFAWGKDVASCFSSSLTTEIKKVCCSFNQQLMLRWTLLTTWRWGYTIQIKQQIENRSDNCILGTIIICSLDTPSWQEI